MDFVFSDTFKAEAEKYNLKYRCIDCIHFEANIEKCSFEYPVEDHHHYFYIMKYPHGNPKFTFCKYLEII